MEIAYGHLRMRPGDFWDLTPREWKAALDGYMAANGVEGENNEAAVTPEEFQDLMQRFPDDAGISEQH